MTLTGSLSFIINHRVNLIFNIMMIDDFLRQEKLIYITKGLYLGVLVN